MSIQKTLRIDDEAGKTLARATSGEDAPSEATYVSFAINRRLAEWREAYALLRQDGWPPAAIMAALDVLNGGWAFNALRPASWFAVSLQDGNEINGAAQKWAVSEILWVELVARLAPAMPRPDSSLEAWQAYAGAVSHAESLGRALYFLAREFWEGNAELSALLERERQTDPNG